MSGMGSPRLGERGSVVNLILDAAAAAPEALAARVGTDEITYGELVAAADDLAAELAALGAGPDVPVGVCVERSVEHVVAVLAALRAGAAFLPLDPSWPAARLRHVLDDAAAPVVIAGPELDDQLAGPGRAVVAARRSAAPGAVARQFPSPGPENLAYVIYTSGSTGEPKGVEITHGNLANLVAWHLAAFGVTSADRCGWTAGLGFDASIWELAPCLAAGASLLAPSEEARNSAEALRQWIVREGVTIAYIPTPLAEAMVRAEWPADAAFRTLLTGGDVLHARPRRGLPFQVVNNYGPTECAVVATSGLVEAESDGLELPSIGRPISNTEIYILDAEGRPAPVGEVGELYIAGANVGRGYRHRPDLTAQGFLSAGPAGATPRRCYRTGDLGCWTGTGEIAFHGRADNQVKQRGHRIEPDEIASVLARHPFVAQCAVVALGEGAEKRLVAYVAPGAANIPRAGELRGFLAGVLPTYMLPDAFVRLPALPLTANGKLDKAALPTPTPANALPSAPYRKPTSPVEIRVARLVEELLEVRGVGLDDNFFLLGGHSLVGAQLVLRLHDLFGAELALRDLFEAQTIQNLTMKVESSVLAMVSAMSDEELQLRVAR